MIVALPRIMDHFVGSLPGWAKLSLGRILSSRCGFMQDKVSYVESSELHSLVVVLNHLLLVLRHLVRSFISDLVQVVQVDF